MATITVIGRFADSDVELSWTDGELAGPEPLLTLARAAVDAGAYVNAPGLDYGLASLASDAHPETVASTLAVGLTSVERIEGVPEAEALPPGSIP